jgi:alcohol dehydrogenase
MLWKPEILQEKKSVISYRLGGGSSIDTAKSVAMMMTNPGDYGIMYGRTRGQKDFTQKGFPLIAIPTTAGTGTEGNPTSVKTNEITVKKSDYAVNFQ